MKYILLLISPEKYLNISPHIVVDIYDQRTNNKFNVQYQARTLMEKTGQCVEVVLNGIFNSEILFLCK